MASGLFGTISEVRSRSRDDGTFTIPLMKNIGYPPFFAGRSKRPLRPVDSSCPRSWERGVRHVRIHRVPYVKIAIAAALPAGLYYLAVALTVHMSQTSRAQGAAAETLPNAKKVLKEGGPSADPARLIIYMLVAGTRRFARRSSASSQRSWSP